MDARVEQWEWTQARTERLVEMAALGHTHSQIAAELGCTRNATIGKMNRLRRAGLVVPRKDHQPDWRAPRTVKAPAAQKPPRVARRPRAGLSDPDLPAFPTPRRREPPGCSRAAQVVAGPVPLLALREWHCRWPLGDPRQPDFRFCGCRKQAGSAYCPEHRALSLNPRAIVSREFWLTEKRQRDRQAKLSRLVAMDEGILE